MQADQDREEQAYGRKPRASNTSQPKQKGAGDQRLQSCEWLVQDAPRRDLISAMRQQVLRIAALYHS